MLAVRNLAVFFVCTTCSGCLGVVAASAAGVGIVKYQRNESAREFDADLDASWLAAQEAMSRLGYGDPVSGALLPLEAVAEYADDADTIRLRLESLSTGGTRLTVRVGRFDSSTHRRKARVILSEVGSILNSDEDLRAWTEKVRELRNSMSAEDPPEDLSGASSQPADGERRNAPSDG